MKADYAIQRRIVVENINGRKRKSLMKPVFMTER